MRQFLTSHNSNLPIRLGLHGSEALSGEAVRRITNDLRHCEIPQQLSNCLNRVKIISLNYNHIGSHQLFQFASVLLFDCQIVLSIRKSDRTNGKLILRSRVRRWMRWRNIQNGPLFSLESTISSYKFTSFSSTNCS